MSKFNVSTNHPLIPNSQEYMVLKKYVSIHSEDRDIKKYPNSTEFEIELPQDYLNVLSIRLESWTFPANYSTFSDYNQNLVMIFQINNPYDPIEYDEYNEYQIDIFQALYSNIEINYSIIIEEGFYNPIQMATELTNKFNNVVTLFIKSFFNNPDNNITQSSIDKFNAEGYTDFVIVYNSVGQKIWFGNKNSQFTLINSGVISENAILTPINCARNQLPDFTNWGLPFYLGLTRDDSNSISSPDGYPPRFYYGDVFPGDNGCWLNPTLINSQSYYLVPPFKINLMGQSYLYLEINGLNTIDETNPFINNSSNPLIIKNSFVNDPSCEIQNLPSSRVNSAFAKIAIPTTPLSQWFDDNSRPYMIYNPPAERIRKIKLKLRYHNGQLVNFSNNDYSFMLEFTLYNSQQQKKYKNYNPENNMWN